MRGVCERSVREESVREESVREECTRGAHERNGNEYLEIGSMPFLVVVLQHRRHVLRHVRIRIALGALGPFAPKATLKSKRGSQIQQHLLKLLAINLPSEVRVLHHPLVAESTVLARPTWRDEERGW
jgi:hypothetical protein